jgi:anti-anti-sigma factor
MTTTPLTAPSSAPGSLDEQGSAVAITLSWSADSVAENALGAGTTLAGGSHLIELIGDINVDLTLRVRDLLTSLATPGTELTVDVSHVRRIDAGGLGMLANLYQRAGESGGVLSLIGTSAPFREIVHLFLLDYLLAGDPPCR